MTEVLKRIAVLTLLLAGPAGCSTLGLDDFFSGETKDETEGWSAEKLYGEAKDSLDSEYYTRASEYYEKFLARFPFGVKAQQAQLDLAYAYYKGDETESALAACDRFIKLYPDHGHTAYAYYLKGRAHFNQGKGLTERYLPIDASQRDPETARLAFEDFSELLKRHPKSRYVADAQQHLVHLRNQLAQHEVNVAHYYMRRGAYVAAANRARYVIENYQGAKVMPEALVLMAKAYRVLSLDELANDAVRVLELNYPQHPGIKEVRSVRLH